MMKKTGTANRRGRVAAAALALLNLVAHATTYHVATDGNDAADGLSWATAKLTIQAAIDLTVSNDVVLVSNGVYATGGRVVYGSLSNRVAITNAITVQSVNGPAFTTIVGAYHPAGTNGDAAVRCVYVGTNAQLAGFTLSNGATRATGDQNRERSGGGAYCDTNAVLSNCLIVACSAFSTGGGVFQGRHYNNTLVGNMVRISGGGAANAQLVNCALRGNASAANGGAASSCQLDSCTILSNACVGFGGGLNGGLASNCLLEANLVLSPSNGFGGAAASAALFDCTVRGNQSLYYAGGLYQCIATNCVITENLATNKAAGGGTAGGAMGGQLGGCLIVGNRSATFGGGAHSATLSGCVLSSNRSERGGASVGGTLWNCLLVGNAAGLGGGDYFSTLVHCTVVDNSATNAGGGVYGSTVRNSIVVSNLALRSPNFTNGLLDHCCTWPAPTNGSNHILSDPLFADYSSGDFRLQSASPCIDAGQNTFATNLATDLVGQFRRAGTAVDLGAYEFHPYWAWAAAITNGLTNEWEDAVGDGVANLIKYAAGANPTQAASGVRCWIDRSATGQPALLFHRSPQATDVTFLPESGLEATGAVTWVALATNRFGSWGGATNVVETGADPLQVEVTAGMEQAGAQLMRLRVTRP